MIGSFEGQPDIVQILLGAGVDKEATDIVRDGMRDKEKITHTHMWLKGCRVRKVSWPLRLLAELHVHRRASGT